MGKKLTFPKKKKKLGLTPSPCSKPELMRTKSSSSQKSQLAAVAGIELTASQSRVATSTGVLPSQLRIERNVTWANAPTYKTFYVFFLFLDNF